MGRLHGLGDHRVELGSQGPQVDLVAELCAEALERQRGVVPAPVEAAVDHPLDPLSGGTEQGCDRERRDGDGEAGALGHADQHELEQQHAAEVGRAQRGGQRTVDERAVDHDVDVVEAEPQQRDRYRHCQAQKGEQQAGPARDLAHAVVEQRTHREAHDQETAGRGHPLELLPFNTPRAAEANDERHGRSESRG